MSSPRHPHGRAIQPHGSFGAGFAAFLQLSSTLPHSLCSKQGGRLLSSFIPWPRIPGGSRAAGRDRIGTCVPDASRCACGTPSICGASHALLPVALPGAVWERSRAGGRREPQQNPQTTLCLLIDFFLSSAHTRQGSQLRQLQGEQPDGARQCLAAHSRAWAGAAVAGHPR